MSCEVLSLISNEPVLDSTLRSLIFQRIYPSRRFLPAKVRAFVDFLAARFAGSRGWA
jgi:DNA-binding transcriptional LysR family regulator